MAQVMVRYRVKPERVEESEELVRAVYDELRRAEPAGLRYATFKLNDGVSFRHLAVTEVESEGSLLSKLQAFQEFQQHIEDRTDEDPVVTALDRIGSFRPVGDAAEH
jgi:quinol monooxygenase YgiN